MKINHSKFTGYMLLGVGTLRTIQDYKNDPKEQKNKNLLRNIVITGSCLAGIWASDKFLSSKISTKKLEDLSMKWSKKAIENPHIDKIVKKLMPKAELKPIKSKVFSEIIEETAKDVLITTTGFLSGICVGQILDRTILKSLKTKNKEEDIYKIHKKNNEIFDYKHHSAKILNNNVSNKILNEKSKTMVSDTVKMLNTSGYIDDPFERPLIVMDSFELSKEKNVKKLFEQTTAGIVFEALIPAFMCSMTNSILKAKSDNVKIPLIILMFFLGNLVGDKAGEIFKRPVEKIKEATNDTMKMASRQIRLM